ncbi:MAG: nickel pincer cofactor biosynthesis protein LarB [Phycisphaerales bacterium]|nr:nickel pincer cofactor biosynthesis protein LarB [Phycisphaerales bacterium]MBT7170423.1 nickel pincer cofactor biosynthesis protein LarB [Phycisphaerales bacterium]
MDETTLRNLLTGLQSGEVDADEVVSALRREPIEELSSAMVDHHRALRCGCGEVIYCASKTPAQVVEIFTALAARGAVLATRADADHAAAVLAKFPAAVYHELSRTIRLGDAPEPRGLVVVIAAGTSDLSVAEEARITAEFLGAKVESCYDCGVAGLHRLLPHLDALQRANAIVAVAGMEGALPSVVGGMVACPVVAVPTSVGYGANLGGITALLAMLNSCASGVSVVNIDNGFGGGYSAALINNQAVKS